jgi:hypothetical protein
LMPSAFLMPVKPVLLGSQRLLEPKIPSAILGIVRPPRYLGSIGTYPRRPWEDEDPVHGVALVLLRRVDTKAEWGRAQNVLSQRVVAPLCRKRRRHV